MFVEAYKVLDYRREHDLIILMIKDLQYRKNAVNWVHILTNLLFPEKIMDLLINIYKNVRTKQNSHVGLNTNFNF